MRSFTPRKACFPGDVLHFARAQKCIQKPLRNAGKVQKKTWNPYGIHAFCTRFVVVSECILRQRELKYIPWETRFSGVRDRVQKGLRFTGFRGLLSGQRPRFLRKYTLFRRAFRAPFCNVANGSICPVKHTFPGTTIF